MRLGHFDDAAREYVIATPQTPWPWINYLGDERLFCLYSNTGGGYTFHRDARLRRLTRHRYNNIPVDTGGKYFYVNDGRASWSLTWQPVKAPYDRYACRHGLGYSVVEMSCRGLDSEVTALIPPGEDIELHRVRLTNAGKRRKTLSLHSFVEFCLWDAAEDDRNFQRNLSVGEVEVADSFIFHKTEYRERRNHYAYFAVNRPVHSFDTDREAFLGSPYTGLDAPATVAAQAGGNSLASGWSPIASHCLQLSLAPGETAELVFGLGYIELPEAEKFAAPGQLNQAPARTQFAKFAGPGAVDAALAALRARWDQLLGVFTVRSPEPRLDRMVNIWNPYQCMVTFNLSRSASYFESGVGRGMGFRDSNQDLLGFVHQIPQRARERILDIAATQLADGGAYHQYQPLTKRGNADVGGNFNDDPLWLILAVGAYLRETGDVAILDVPVPFENRDDLAAPLLEHLFRSYRFTLANRGPHGLPLIGRADWNDCLNLNCFSTTPGESFQTTGNRTGGVAESLMIAGLFVHACGEFADLLAATGRNDAAREIRTAAAAMTAAVDAHGRDRDWFLRAYDYFGHKVGSAENPEGKIFIESQGWCAMAGIGHADGFARRALDSVAEHLATPHGIVLQDPPYSTYHVELGEVSSYPPGYKENGGIFCHNNPWIVIAETLLGNPERAFDYYTRICPAWREAISEIHRMEPYVYSQMIAGKAAVRHGEAKNSWLTGTAAWNYVAATQHILGIRPGHHGLVVRPCLPAALAVGTTVTRIYRDTEYTIHIRAAQPGETPGIIVDGQPFSGDEIPTGGLPRRAVEVTLPAR
jgi:cellobiose phosphorylase